MFKTTPDILQHYINARESGFLIVAQKAVPQVCKGPLPPLLFRGGHEPPPLHPVLLYNLVSWSWTKNSKHYLILQQQQQISDRKVLEANSRADKLSPIR